MRVLCVGDSLGLPRKGCPYEKTWFFKLAKKYPNIEFVDYFKRGLVLTETVNLYNMYYTDYKPDIFIIQTGICDCAPRYLNSNKLFWKLLLNLLGHLGFESYFWKIIKFIFSRRENCVYTKVDVFSQLYRNLIEKFIANGVKKIIVVKIGHAAESVAANNCYFNSNVDKYNNIINKIAVEKKDHIITIDPLHNVHEDLFVDGYHCNSNGMEKVYHDLDGLEINNLV